MIYNLKKILYKFIFLFSIVFSIINVFPSLCYSEEDNKKCIYLTFDDGPGGKTTAETLDILKRENVPATFFLIGEQIKGQEELINRMLSDGHSIGLHSMTHDRNKLYCNNECFLKEMLDTQALIKEVTGETTNIMRFPFGCNNEKYHLKKELIELLHKNNLKIYDWNVDSTDGAHPASPPSTFIKNSKSNKNNIILLMHCGYQNKNSPKALPEVIKYYKDQGYEFKKITPDTNEEFHFINKKGLSHN